MRGPALVIVLAGCDAVFGTPFDPADDAVRDAAVDAMPGECSEMDVRLCITFEGDSDVAIDGSSFDNDATLTNVVRVARTPIANAVEVGATSEIRIEDDVGLELAGPLTYAMWLFSEIGQNNPGTGFDNHAQFAIAASTGTVNCIFTLASTGGPIATGAPLVPDKWTHVACVKDETGLTLYIDGGFASKNASTEATGAVATGNPEPVRIGADSQPGGLIVGRWIGRLDDVYVFARALDPAEVFDLAQQ